MSKQKRPPIGPGQAVAFVAEHGIVLQSAQGPVPSLAEAVAGEPIAGSWWGHAKGRAIYAACEAVTASPDVLTCKLVGGKVTFVHRRLWPALARLAARFPRGALDRTWNEHTRSGEHRARREAFPGWVPADARAAAETLDEAEAEALLRAAGLELPPGGAAR